MKKDRVLIERWRTYYNTKDPIAGLIKDQPHWRAGWLMLVKNGLDTK